MDRLIGPPKNKIYQLDVDEVTSLSNRQICYIVSVARNDLYIGNNPFKAIDKTYRAVFEQRDGENVNCYFPDYFHSYKYRWKLLESLPPNWRIYSDGQITNIVSDEIAKAGTLTWSVVVSAAKHVVYGKQLFREKDHV
jgi:hypothetical protein